MKTIIHENQKGLLFKNGKYIRLLDAGKYYTFLNHSIEIVSLDEKLMSTYASLETLLKDSSIQQSTTIVEVQDEEIALHYVNEHFVEVLPVGKYAFWNSEHQHTFLKISIQDCYVQDDIPKYIFDQIPTSYYIKIEVKDYQKARLFLNNQCVQLLDSGTYYFWKNATKIEYQLIDTRLSQMNIVGQEILTQDKVSLRINFVCYYRILDYMRVFDAFDDYQEQLRVIAQLIMREFIGQYKIDDLLENKEMIGHHIYQKLKEKAQNYDIEITEAGIKDIILPGEIRNIMNTVLIAQKQAQANVITRREEVASTRSLLNTAKLMDENKTLYKLKELEYLERICANVGEINVNSHQQLLSQLTHIFDEEE